MKSIKLKALLTEKLDINDPQEVADLLRGEINKTTGAFNKKQSTNINNILKKNKIPKDVEEKAWDILYSDAKDDPDWFIEVVLGM